MSARRAWLAAAAAMLVGFGASAPAQDSSTRLRLGELRLHLLNRDTGALSGDLLHSALPTATWNLSFGSGAPEGPADDALVVLPIRAEKDARGQGEVSTSAPIVIRVRLQSGKLLAQRRFAGVATSRDGVAHLALWLPDVGCAGDLTMEASMARQRVSARYGFRCGE